MAAIYTLFAGLAATGWAAGASAATSRRGVGIAGRVATGIIGAMFVGTYSVSFLGQAGTPCQRALSPRRSLRAA